MAQLVERLLCKQENLSSTLSTTYKAVCGDTRLWSQFWEAETGGSMELAGQPSPIMGQFPVSRETPVKTQSV